MVIFPATYTQVETRPGAAAPLIRKNSNVEDSKVRTLFNSSYAKILVETNFHTREIPRSGSKAKDGERREKKRKED